MVTGRALGTRWVTGVLNVSGHGRAVAVGGSTDLGPPKIGSTKIHKTKIHKTKYTKPNTQTKYTNTKPNTQTQNQMHKHKNKYTKPNTQTQNPIHKHKARVTKYWRCHALSLIYLHQCCHGISPYQASHRRPRQMEAPTAFSLLMRF